MSVVLRELEAGDVERYHQFLEAGAAAHSDTLRFSPLDLESRPFDTTTTANRVTLLAEDPDRWCGVGTLERELGRTKRAHIAWVVRMVVAVPNRGIGRSILRALIGHARQYRPARPSLRRLTDSLVVSPRRHAMGPSASWGLERRLHAPRTASPVRPPTARLLPLTPVSWVVPPVHKVKTVEGREFTLGLKDGKVSVDGANVIKTDIAASNGVIHVIDTVIMPK